jgi:hypothetical protein
MLLFSEFDMFWDPTQCPIQRLLGGGDFQVVKRSRREADVEVKDASNYTSTPP